MRSVHMGRRERVATAGTGKQRKSKTRSSILLLLLGSCSSSSRVVKLWTVAETLVAALLHFESKHVAGVFGSCLKIFLDDAEVRST